jgi:uncharacterized protein YdiU (UPF0061 family)
VDKADEELVEALLATFHATGADFTNGFRALMRLLAPGEGAGTSAGAGAGVGVASVGATAPTASDAAAAAGDALVLDALVAQCTSARDAAERARPSVPLARLEAFRALALSGSSPQAAAQLPEVEAEIARHASHAALARRSDADKRAEDRAAWAAWLARFRARLAAEAAAAAARGEDLAARARARRARMARANPKYVLRNWVAHAAILAAERGDFAPARAVHARLRDPYGLGDADGGEGLGSAHDGFHAPLAALAARLMREGEAGAGAGAGAGAVGEDAGANLGAEAASEAAAPGGLCRVPRWAAALKVS